MLVSKKQVDHLYKDVVEANNKFHELLENEFKAVYDNAISEGIIKGKPTKAKFKNAGYLLVYTPDGAARICRNGIVVSKVVYAGEEPHTKEV